MISASDTRQAIPGSFRDHLNGFVFREDGVLYRQINQNYRRHYDLLRSSGLYDRLIEKNLLVPFSETAHPGLDPLKLFRVIKPQEIPFVSYPYEWSFSQLKDAALCTLAVQKMALDSGMSLKDASAYNVQFSAGKPVFIDTLSFETYEVGMPWTAYGQFCRHFLAPLSLMSLLDRSWNQILRLHMDGVPLALASKALPRRSHWNLSLLIHLHWHAKLENSHNHRAAETAKEVSKKKMSIQSLKGLIDHLEKTISSLDSKVSRSHWVHYGLTDSYSEKAQTQKKDFVMDCLARSKPKVVWDLGANKGFYSRLATDSGAFTVAMDSDPDCIETLYRETSDKKNLLPLFMDLANPSPATGWANEERMSLAERGPADLLMALALVHHLVIGNQIPLERVAKFMRSIGRSLLIEWVPKEDPQVRKLLALREDVYEDYSQGFFEKSFGVYFEIEKIVSLSESGRVLYFMRGK